MTVKVIAPLIGEGVEELSLVAWKKKPGDRVTEGEALVELESDKVVTEVPSPASGTVAELLAAEGDSVRAGAAIAIIDSGAVDGAAAEFLSPVVRKIAAERGVDPAAVTGTGAGGRVTKEDILAYAASTDGAAPGAPTLRPHGPVRKRIADRMIASQRTSAHVLAVAEADMSAVVAHRAASVAAFASQGTRLTYSAYFVAAIASALRLCPEMNSSWSEEGMILHPEINVGVAVSLGEGGLIVPVVKRADTLSLLQTARDVDRLALAARAGTLGNEDVKGGTFTLTNYGTTGSLVAAPIINQPQIGILGTGTLQKRAVVITSPEGYDSIAIRPMVYLSLVFDHRALDGEAGSRFLRAVKEGLEAWK